MEVFTLETLTVPIQVKPRSPVNPTVNSYHKPLV